MARGRATFASTSTSTSSATAAAAAPARGIGVGLLAAAPPRGSHALVALAARKQPPTDLIVARAAAGLHDEDKAHAAAAGDNADAEAAQRTRQRALAETLARIGVRVTRLHGASGGFKLVAELADASAVDDAAASVLLESFGHALTAQAFFACEGDGEDALVKRAARWNAEHRLSTAWTLAHPDGELTEVLQADLLLCLGVPDAVNDALVRRWLRAYAASLKAWELKLAIELHRGAEAVKDKGFWGAAATRAQ